jgi:hypothetical protein
MLKWHIFFIKEGIYERIYSAVWYEENKILEESYMRVNCKIVQMRIPNVGWLLFIFPIQEYCTKPYNNIYGK